MDSIFFIQKKCGIVAREKRNPTIPSDARIHDVCNSFNTRQAVEFLLCSKPLQACSSERENPEEGLTESEAILGSILEGLNQLVPVW